MKKRPSWLPITVPATALSLVLTFSPTPTNSSVPHPSQPAPDLAEVKAMHRIAGWALGSGSSLKVLRAGDLKSALGEEESGFTLFARKAEDPQAEVLASLPYGDAIAEVARRHQVDGLLVAAVVEAESSFRPKALSPRGAMGLMQVMPATGEQYDADDLFDPEVNLEVGSRYLGSLIDHYDGDLTLALAAYNAGPATVARYGGVPPYQETRDYVERVLARYLDHHESCDERASTAVKRSDARPMRAKTSGRRGGGADVARHALAAR